MTNNEYTLTAEINVQLEDEKVWFVGEAVTDKYINFKQLEKINEDFVNQAVIYRHDHPSKGKGGSIYGRVKESEIVEKEDGTHAIKFKSLMRQDLQKHKDLIGLAQTQQKLGKPIGYSVGFLDSDSKETAEIYEVSVTNKPVCEECENLFIMEKEKMTKEEKNLEVDKDKELIKKEVIKLQNKFEESIDFKKEFEKKDKEASDLKTELEAKDSLITESKEVLKLYESRITELEKRADVATRTPIVEKIYALERNEMMKERYMDTKHWSVEELNKQYETIKGLNKGKINVQQATTRTLEQSRHKLMGDEPKETSAEMEKIKSAASPEMKKAMGWN